MNRLRHMAKGVDSHIRQPLRVLLVEDSEDDADLVLREIQREYDVTYRRVQTAPAMQAAIAEAEWDIIISDFSMPEFDALAAIKVFQASGTDIPFIITSGTIGEDTAVAALKAGAHDFMAKGRLARLLPAIRRELTEAVVRNTARKVDQALHESESRFRAVADSASDALISVDDGGRIVYMNLSAERMFGYPQSDLYGQRLMKLLPECSCEVLLASISHSPERASSPTSGRIHEVIGRRIDGMEFPAEMSLANWIADGKTYYTVIVRDASERKQLETQLITSDRMVSLGTLAAGVAHEINNPLAAILANLDIVMHDLQKSTSGVEPSPLMNQVNDALRDSNEAATRIRQIVRDLKVFSRAEEDICESVDVHKVIDFSLRMAWNEVRHRARIVKNYSDVPHVAANESRLGQVMLNLIVNAAQSIPLGMTERHEIVVSTGMHWDGRVYIDVRDTGAGMTHDVLRRLFEPFFTTKPIGAGTGLGLAICHRIITGLGGDITAQSTVGEGSLFRVFLPVSHKVTSEMPEPTSTSPTVAQRRRVLMVDDEVDLANAFGRILARNHDVTVVHSAEDALKRIAAGELFDVILCDLMMPQMTGMDTYAELEKIAPVQVERIIFMTGGAFTVAARAFLDRISNLCIDKPFDIPHLLRIIADRKIYTQ